MRISNTKGRERCSGVGSRFSVFYLKGYASGMGSKQSDLFMGYGRAIGGVCNVDVCYCYGHELNICKL